MIRQELSLLLFLETQAVDNGGKVRTNRMCSEEQIDKIADMTAVYYDQLAVMYYRVADKVTVKHYG